MSSPIFLTILFTIAAIAAIFGSIEYLSRCRRLTIVEVPKLLRPAEVNDFRNLLLSSINDPILQSVFRPRAYRESLRLRLFTAQEYMRRMSHNTLILFILARTEQWRETKYMPGMENSQQFIELAQKLLLASLEFRIYTLLTLLRIKWWMVCRIYWWLPLPTPRIGNLGAIGPFKFTACYNRFKEATGALCLAHGQEFYDEIMSKF